MVDSIIFDLDGTLWDSSEGVLKAWNEAIEEAGYDFSLSMETIGSIMGLPIQDIANKVFAMLPEEKRLPMLRKCFDKEVVILGETGGRLMEGLEETLQILQKKYRLFIVSNCQDGYVQTFLKAHHMEQFFVDFLCVGDEGITKGEGNRKLIQQYDLKQAVYVVDTTGDQQSAKEAGIDFIFARFGFGTAKNYLYSIDYLAQLPEILDEIV